jgi:hypothetical protein
MQFKNFVSKKVLISGFAITAVGLGIVAGLAYRSAHGEQIHSNPNNAYNQYASAGDPANVGDGIAQSSAANSNAKASSTKIKTSTTSGNSKSTSTSKSATSTSAVDTSCPIKAVTNSKGKKVFYLANNKSYKRIKSQECFKTVLDATSAGYANAVGQ